VQHFVAALLALAATWAMARSRVVPGSVAGE